MALAAASALGSFDQGGNREDVSDVYEMLVENDIDVVQKTFGIKGEAKATKHEWVEGELGSNRSSTAASATSAGTSVVVYSGDGTKFRIGTVFKIEASGEYIQVTSISTDTLAVTRGFGSTTAEAITNGAVIRIVNHPAQEDAEISTITRTADVIRAKAYNYTQVFFDWVRVSTTQEKVDKAGVGSEVDEQVKARLLRFKRDVDASQIMGWRSANAGSDSAYRTFGGLMFYMSGGNATDCSASALTLAYINQMMQDIYDDGGNPTLLIAPPIQKKKISQLYASYLHVQRVERTVGQVVDTIETDFGTVTVLMSRNVENDKLLFIDPSRVAFMPLTGCAFGMEDVAKTGRAYQKYLDGEYTMEVRNGTKAHGYLYNLATS